MSDQIGRRRLGMRDAVVVVLVTLLSAGCGANPELPQATPASTTAAPPQRVPPTPADTGKPCTSVLGTTVTVQVAGRPVAVHLPVCYQRSSARYPAIYLLHGAGADETQWLDVGAATASDELTRTGVTKPAILVIPDIDGLPAAAADRFVIESLLPWVDQHYRTMADARHRSIGGISRGGARLCGSPQPDRTCSRWSVDTARPRAPCPKNWCKDFGRTRGASGWTSAPTTAWPVRQRRWTRRCAPTVPRTTSR